MSVPFHGDFDTTETVNLPFNTFSSDDPSVSVTVTDLVAGDVKIHKDGGVTQRDDPAGVTRSIDFDGITGNHMIHIDLSDNTDAGFYSDGSRYQVRLEGITVDGVTLNVWIGAFSIGCTLRPTTAGRTLDIQSTGEVDANLTMMGGGAQSATDLKDFADAGYDPGTNKVQGVVLTDTCTANSDLVTAAAVRTEMDSNSTQLAAILTDTGTTLDGKIDTIDTNVDSILTDTGTTLQGELDAIQAAVITNAAGTDIAADIIAVKAETASILTDTGTTLQAEVDAIQAAVITNAAGTDIAADIIAIKAETATIVADTGELQADDTPGALAAIDAKIDTIDTNVDSVLTDTGTTLQGELDAIQAAVITNAAGTDIAADIIAVKAETATIVADTGELQTDWANGGRLDLILDEILAMLDDARGEPGDTAPPVNPDAMTKLDYLYKFMRNKVESTATKIHVYDDGGTNKDHTSTISDDATTFTRGEFLIGE